MMYLYNGVQLPALPEWDRETYPYAMIVASLDRTVYFLVVYEQERMCDDDSGLTSLSGYGCIYESDGNSWLEEATHYSGYAVWANYDVCYETDGTVYTYLAASTPIPVGGSIPEQTFLGMLLAQFGVIPHVMGKGAFGGVRKYPMGPLASPPMPFPSSYSHTSTWVEISFNNVPGNLNRTYLWSDGKNLYYSNAADQYILHGDTWVEKTWNWNHSQLSPDHTPRIYTANYVWTDGKNMYCHIGLAADMNYILDGDTWVEKNWNVNIAGGNIWSDGINIYSINSTINYILKNGIWVEMTWGGENPHSSGPSIWSDGFNIYRYELFGHHYVLNSNTWVEISWNISSDILESDIWSDGDNVYYSDGSKQYVLKDGIWVEKTWNGVTSFIATNVWSDGKSIYMQSGDKHYILK